MTLAGDSSCRGRVFALAALSILSVAASPVMPVKVAEPAIPAKVAKDPPSGIQRTVIHTEAYKKREGLGPHIEIKVTPPEKAGRKGYILVEVYNYSTRYLAAADFWLNLGNQWGDNIETHITCEDIKGGWSGLKWIKVAGNKPVPEITKVQIVNMKMFTDQAREMKLKYTVDLIKQ